MRYYVTLPHDAQLAVDVVQQADGELVVSVAGEGREIDVVDADGALNVRVGDRIYDLWIDGEGGEGEIAFSTASLRMRARIESERSRVADRASRAGLSGGRVRAPMPGRVVKLLAAEGDEVRAGAPLIVVEAMKMENELCADRPGVVSAVHAAAGDNVEAGTVLVELAPLP